jgi:hypothetical protein
MKTVGSSAGPAGIPGFREVMTAPVIRQRILEYLGGAHHGISCRFLGRLDPFNPSRFERHPVGELDHLIHDGCELARSLGDRTFLILHLDIEYVNFDDPAAAYTHPERAFLLQEPLVKVIEERLLTLGIRYLHVVTGQGHHFVWKIRKGSAVARTIARLGICNTPDLEAAPDPLFAHAALLMEHLAHLLKPAAAAACEVPVEITALHVGPGLSGAREMLSIDISEYGDPLPSRMIRIPFTVYRKPWASGLIRRLGIASRVPEFFTLPLHEMDVLELIRRRHDPATILELAQRAPVRIPVEEKGTARLLESYQQSALAAFHRRFHGRGHPYPSRRWQAATAAAIRKLPPCARHVLAFPNDLLLKPSGMQLVTRCLIAQGWHPRHVSALIAARFLDPAFHWGSHWDDYDPVMRAEFYVRLFAGEISCGIERGIDFNCVSQQEKSFCWSPRDCNLAPLHARLYPATKNEFPPP